MEPTVHCYLQQLHIKSFSESISGNSVTMGIWSESKRKYIHQAVNACSVIFKNGKYNVCCKYVLLKVKLQKWEGVSLSKKEWTTDKVIVIFDIPLTFVFVKCCHTCLLIQSLQWVYKIYITVLLQLGIQRLKEVRWLPFSNTKANKDFSRAWLSLLIIFLLPTLPAWME